MRKNLKTILPVILFTLLLYSCNGSKRNSGESKSTNELNYIIVYNVQTDDENDDYDIFTMEVDGNNKKNVTNHPDVAWTYNSINDKILFISDRDTCPRCYFLYEMDVSGNNVKRITNFRLRDSWISSRKNGSELIVTPHQTVDSVFYIIDRNGKVLQRIKPKLVYYNDPAFSPDGKQIVFRGAEKQFKKDSGYLDELYLINDNGEGLIKLTQYPVSDTSSQWYNYHAGPPKWHPKENFISYQSFRNGKYSLYAVTPDGSNQWKLTNSIQSEGWHDWSPDGKWLAVDLFDKDQTRIHIGLINLKTKELKILTDTTYKYQQAPSFVLKQIEQH